MVYHYYPEIQSRFSLLNTQYNLGCTQFDLRYNNAQYPIYIGAFKPNDKQNIDKFINKNLISTELYNIFKTYELY